MAGMRDVTGLVLGGGAALGAAHVGVIEVLEELGIDISVVVGTSIGGVMGAAYAAGLNVAAMRDLLAHVSWADFGQLTLERRLGLLDVTPLKQAIVDILGDHDIEDLPRRFGAVASDVRTRSPVLMRTGSLTTALAATVAVPGIFPPVHRGEHLLIDGAFTSNVPIWAARELGATRVISVTLRPTWNRTRLGQWVTEALGVVINHEPADVEIHPVTDGFSKWSAHDVPALVEAGRVAALKAFENFEDAGR